MKDVNGIQTPFDNAIAPVPGADQQTGGGTKGGYDLRDGQKQEGGGETGTWVTTADLPNAAAPGLARPSGMSGS